VTARERERERERERGILTSEMEELTAPVTRDLRVMCSILQMLFGAGVRGVRHVECRYTVY